MSRPLGNRNKTPEEMEAAAKRLIERARLKRKLERIR